MLPLVFLTWSIQLLPIFTALNRGPTGILNTMFYSNLIFSYHGDISKKGDVTQTKQISRHRFRLVAHEEQQDSGV